MKKKTSNFHKNSIGNPNLNRQKSKLNINTAESNETQSILSPTRSKSIVFIDNKTKNLLNNHKNDGVDQEKYASQKLIPKIDEDKDKSIKNISIIDDPINGDYSVPEMKTQENTDNIKVIVRFRPLNSVEKDLFERGMGGICVKYTRKDGVSLTNSVGFTQSFTFDRVFDSNTEQKSLFDDATKSIIDDILKGYNGTIFTYGQSGSGKTHTMYGSSLYDNDLKGIVPRSIEYMFDYINDVKNENIKFQIKFSMLEIYKENLYDLLNPEVDTRELKIKETKDKQIYVSNLTEEYITTIEEFLLLIDQADQYRVVSETGLNKQSSRSHLLFIIEVLQQLPDGSEKCGKLNLIDLAGSEKISKTGAQGETLEEAKKINLSLSTLGNVISSLSSDKDYIPYRDSKLTRILQDSLGGNYKTTLIVTCSPHVFNAEESIATLKFGTRAKKIKNKVKQNIKKSSEELERIIEDLSCKLNKAKSEIQRLRLKIKDLPMSVKEMYELIEEEEKFMSKNDDKRNFSQKFSSDLQVQASFSYQICNNQNLNAYHDNASYASYASENVMSNHRIGKLSYLDNIEEDIETSFEKEKKTIEKKEILEIKGESKEDKENHMNDLNNSSLISDKSSKFEKEKENKEITSKKLILKKENKENQSNFKQNEKIEALIKEKTNLSYKNSLLKEKIDELQRKITDETQNSLNKITNLLNKLEEISKTILVDYKKIQQQSKEDEKEEEANKPKTQQYYSSLIKQNQELKKLLSKKEEEFSSFFKRQKLFENENFIENTRKTVSNPAETKENIDFLSFISHIKQNERLYKEYKEYIEITKSTLLKEVITFFSAKNDFFNGELYKNNDFQLDEIERLKMNHLKSGFIKFSSLSIYYEKILYDIISKNIIDFEVISLEKQYVSDVKSVVLKFYDMFNRVFNAISELKKVKLEEIGNVMSLSKENKENDEKGNFRRSFLRKTLIKKVNNKGFSSKFLGLTLTRLKLLGSFVGSGGLNNVNNVMMNNKKYESLNSLPLFNLGLGCLAVSPKNTYENMNMNMNTTNNNNNNNNYNNTINSTNSNHNNKQQVSLEINEDNSKQNNKNTNTINLQQRDRVKNLISPVKKKMKKEENSNKTKEKQSFISKPNQTNHQTQSQIQLNNQNQTNTITATPYNPYININNDQQEDSLKEIKLLKNEVSMYKLHMEMMNDKFEIEEKKKVNLENIYKKHQERTSLIFKNEIQNLFECFNVYREFYEEELVNRKNIIEELSLRIESMSGSGSKNQIQPNPNLQNKPNKPNNTNTILNKSNSNTLIFNNINSPKQVKQVKQRNFNQNNESNIINIINDNGASFFNSNLVGTEENFNKNEYSQRLFQSNSCSFYNLNDVFQSQFRSATKRTDFIKIENKSKNRFSIQYGNGLGHKAEGKSPLFRSFKYSLCGDTCDDVICSESFAVGK